VGLVKAAIREAVIEGTIPPGDPARAREWIEAHTELLRDD
jgi:hypothetical protein